MNKIPKSNLSQIPSVDSIISLITENPTVKKYSTAFLTSLIRKNIQDIRQLIIKNKYDGEINKKTISRIISDNVKEKIDSIESGNVIKAVNATGVILHTGLGRAPLSKSAVKQVINILDSYSVLEVDKKTGKRGQRDKFLEEIICYLCKSEASMVVNNNAAAIMLALNGIAAGKEVIISRGELVEIGGSFRMPDIMKASGAKMVEIGTTNKTKIADYESAVTADTGAILLVHTSNYRVLGFTHTAELKDIASLAKRKKIPLIYDLGGGILNDLRDFGLPYEPVASEVIKSGVDVITFSGDKILGGPQSGIITGKKKYVDLLKKNPITRTLRCDKIILAALEGTLRTYLKGIGEFKKLPAIKMLLEKPSKVKLRAEKLAGMITNKDIDVKILPTYAEIGSGALPLEKIQSYAVALTSKKISAAKIAARLRNCKTPVFGYINDNKMYLDLKAVRTEELKIIKEAVENFHN